MGKKMLEKKNRKNLVNGLGGVGGPTAAVACEGHKKGHVLYISG